MKIIDLSHPITTGMPTYPNDTPTVLETVAELTQDGYHQTKVTFSPHTGTHIDAPAHMKRDSRHIKDFPLDSFTGNAKVYDVRNQNPITVLNDFDTISEGDIILLRTDHSTQFGTPTYYETYPEVSLELAQALAQKKIKLLGLDTPSPDYPPFTVHKTLFNADILIIENLTNLTAIQPYSPCLFAAFPLSLACEASPLRAVAFIED